MTTTVLINKNPSLCLGNDPRGYLWKDYGKYSYRNNDNLGLGYGRLKKMGKPEEEHYDISFCFIPEGRKKSVGMYFYFDGNGKYTYAKVTCKMTQKALKEIEKETLSELIHMGLIREGC